MHLNRLETSVLLSHLSVFLAYTVNMGFGMSAVRRLGLAFKAMPGNGTLAFVMLPHAQNYKELFEDPGATLQLSLCCLIIPF